jgi:hypothetical protein
MNILRPLGKTSIKRGTFGLSTCRSREDVSLEQWVS